MELLEYVGFIKDEIGRGTLIDADLAQQRHELVDARALVRSQLRELRQLHRWRLMAVLVTVALPTLEQLRNGLGQQGLHALRVLAVDVRPHARLHSIQRMPHDGRLAAASWSADIQWCHHVVRLPHRSHTIRSCAHRHCAIGGCKIPCHNAPV